ncbi:hypothetical protein [Parendozoicomonas haliclonae]|uniref:Uncharacterized protein n=1 Tax=Parendozoicomonas haliclonae TaxID=1960125 RepID=A0A1X7AIL7_9GAMM|nr:hypothetical protein [Parendozoicomonas haliclonae]SMA45153.1 hypothetical protein EHSB41UT_01859 [Parendozoicomonas haliclonae]
MLEQQERLKQLRELIIKQTAHVLWVARWKDETAVQKMLNNLLHVLESVELDTSFSDDTSRNEYVVWRYYTGEDCEEAYALLAYGELKKALGLIDGAFSGACDDHQETSQVDSLLLAGSHMVWASRLLSRSQEYARNREWREASLKRKESRKKYVQQREFSFRNGVREESRRIREVRRYAAKKRHEPTSKLKEKVLELYQANTYPSARRASKDIAPKLREWAALEGIPALAVENEERTISEWIRAYKKQQAE